jgi:hypothetical protein
VHLAHNLGFFPVSLTPQTCHVAYADAHFGDPEAMAHSFRREASSL